MGNETVTPKMLQWIYNERNCLTSWHKISPHRLKCCWNQSINQVILKKMEILKKIRFKMHHHHHHHGALLATELPDPLPPPVFIVHHSWQVYQAISCIGTEQLLIGANWSSNLCSSMWRGPLEYIAYEFDLNSPAEFHMSGSSNFDSFRDGWQVAVQLLFCGVLTPRLVQYSSQHSYVITVKIFLHTFT